MNHRHDRNLNVAKVILGLAIVASIVGLLVEHSYRRKTNWIAECQQVLELELAACETLWESGH